MLLMLPDVFVSPPTHRVYPVRLCHSWCWLRGCRSCWFIRSIQAFNNDHKGPRYCSVTTDVTHLCLRPCGQSTTELTAAGLLTLGGPMVGAPRDGFRFAWILSLYWVVLLHAWLGL